MCVRVSSCVYVCLCVCARRDLGHDECGELAALLEPLADGGLDAWLAAARAAGGAEGGEGGGAQLSGIPLSVVRACWGGGWGALCEGNRSRRRGVYVWTCAVLQDRARLL